MIRVVSSAWLASFCALALLLYLGIRIDWHGNLLPASKKLDIDPDKTAEETFKSIEETIEKARTLRVLFTYEVKELRNRATRGGGTLLVRTGNKAWYSTNTRGSEDWRVCDGIRVQHSTRHPFDEGIIAPDRRPREKDLASPEVERNLRVLIARAGMVVNGLASVPFEPETSISFKDIFRISRLRSGENLGRTKTLTFQLAIGERGRPVEVTLEYDPESFKPLKRTTTQLDDDGSRRTITESYPEVTLNADIPDDRFKPPEE